MTGTRSQAILSTMVESEAPTAEDQGALRAARLRPLLVIGIAFVTGVIVAHWLAGRNHAGARH